MPRKESAAPSRCVRRLPHAHRRPSGTQKSLTRRAPRLFRPLSGVLLPIWRSPKETCLIMAQRTQTMRSNPLSYSGDNKFAQASQILPFSNLEQPWAAAIGGFLCALHVPKAAKRSTRSSSVTLVLRPFWPLSAQRNLRAQQRPGGQCYRARLLAAA